jgi:multidrug efflux pump subunit AcrA (membrane-fusion protein)
VNKKKILYISGISVLILLILFIFLSNRPAKTETIKVIKATFEEKVLGVGRMEAGTEKQLKSEVSGNILHSDVNEGTSLSAGDVIFVIDGADQAFVVAEKKAAYLIAQSQYKNLSDYQLPAAKEKVRQTESDKNAALKSYNDAKSLYAEGAISNNALMDTANRYQSALSIYNSAVLAYDSLTGDGSLSLQGQSQVEAAKAAYDMALAQSAKYTIKAEANAILLKKYAEAGTYVQPGQSLADLGTLNNPFVSAELDERYFPYVKPGMAVSVFVDSSSRFNGAIASVSPKIDASTGSFNIKIGLTSEFPYKAANLTVNLEIVLVHVPDAISIPENYVVRDGKITSVWLYKGGSIKRTDIVSDPSLSGSVLVRSGLSEGDILAKPQPDFKDGAKISI